LVAAFPKPSDMTSALMPGSGFGTARALMGFHADSVTARRAREISKATSEAAARAAKSGNPADARVSERDLELPDAVPTHTVKATLILCPNTLIAQWENEIREKFPEANLRVGVHYQNRRVKHVSSLDEFDVVCAGFLVWIFNSCVFRY
jgi:hypothetical protein